MIDLHLIGIGTGNPDHLTRAAEAAMRAADLILLPRKRADTADLYNLRRALCDAVLTPNTRVVAFDLPVRDAAAGYLTGVRAWHAAIADAWATQIATHLPGGGRLALLVWGDPSLYDSTLRIAARLRAGGLELRVTVVPGITSLQALTAAHAIPLNDLGAPVLITTGRQLATRGWPTDATTVAVMLDGEGAFAKLDPTDTQIWWSAYLGMPQQALLAGPLAETGPAILARRSELRADHGWIMDCYLLRRTPA
ncbi:precorrin-6A synthase (deacetylating) [Sphingomonas prati]|uniref:Precorrin-6A synthase [deacetylating] n=1 Tax=Sphingomonas prati TaxID=1843237 RepID=A0A7W9F0W8_9SPHN|nr:precorrin-6A synthase (deacetylating) [Sphingomonas prati]MBB5728701.1 precorrin-6A synthase [Sphingomonas prati]GGE71769.1 precorrin-6A synthase (deacetylating) [Sphingomonas prati]